MNYDNKNTGAIWKVDKLTSDNQEYYNGKIDVNGTEYNITMFHNESTNSKAPLFRVKIHEYKAYDKDKDYTKKETAKEKNEHKFGTQFEDMGKQIEEEESNLPF